MAYQASASGDSSAVDPDSGYSSTTKTFHSLRPHVPLPPPSQPLSISHYALSLLPPSSSSSPSSTFLVDAPSGHRLSYPDFLRRVRSLALSLQSRFSLSKGDVAFVLAPPSLHVPVVYFSLLSIGVVISPANPLGSPSEIAQQCRLCRPAIAFSTSQIAPKLPRVPRGTVLVDSPEFDSMLTGYGWSGDGPAAEAMSPNRVEQSDSAAILFSSGTTGRVKGVLLTHRNLIALLAGLYYLQGERDESEPHPVSLFTLPLFHVFGFFMLVRAFALGETAVLMDKFDFVAMLGAIEKYRVTYMPVSPPLIVAFVKSEITGKYDLSSLQALACGGAPLGKEVADRFRHRFPHVQIGQGYGLTETCGGATRMLGPDEANHHGSAGRIAENMEAKIVDPITGEALPPGQRGELWLRGPTIMKGYVGDDKATAETIDSDGWLRTGDLCYIDSKGFLFIVDRLKELIKYKGYQVAPAELEHLLHSNLDITDAAVIPYPDEEAGQIPMAFVVRKPGSKITESQVMDFIAKQVAPYKKIRRVAFVSSIPKSPSGKILRRELVLAASVRSANL
ncbi:4-coumarate--CoA ligase-like 9 [Rhodamnia argentea]|uniref:4-coumarate--CoA ligase-like 9 n=1 Tax=Rhodamnia argentea TaxID=178133 RepID=A0ABM3HKZ8_9MYRT|nr:4-coumarate--CoA ligase-like 9 [Rhodamnia argentea]